MVAAFSYWQLWQDWHWPFLLAIAFIVLVEAPLLAIAVEFVLFRRIHGATVERSLMVSLGLLVILLGIATIFWSSPDVIRSVPAYFTAADGTVAAVHLFGANGITIQDQQILIVVVAAVVAVVLGVFLRSFRLGVAMRAVVDDPDLVAMAGAKPHRMAQMGWALGFMLAALAGVLIAPLVGQTGLTSTQLTLLALNGFAAAVVGRLRNLPMTFVGSADAGADHPVLRRLPAGPYQSGPGGGAHRGRPGALPLRRAARDPRGAARPGRPAGRAALAQGGHGAPVRRRRRAPRGGHGRPGRPGGSDGARHALAGPGVRHRRALPGAPRGLRRPGVPVPADVHGHRRIHDGQGAGRRLVVGCPGSPSSCPVPSARWWRCPRSACAASTWRWRPSPSAR